MLHFPLVHPITKGVQHVTSDGSAKRWQCDEEVGQTETKEHDDATSHPDRTWGYVKYLEERLATLKASSRKILASTTTLERDTSCAYIEDLQRQIAELELEG